MPFKIKGRTYHPTKRLAPKNAFSTFRYKKSTKGKAYLLLGKLRRPTKVKRGRNKGKLRRWALYEVLEAT